ncbi:MAG: NADP-dependent oxidoreductase [Bacteroidetes bacterium]|mgnify:CR=1 FL=1|nr:MAG: NADP-dependent oxidoreductase [Bacteroidota bacterium]REK34598.1 MAG: NADP-dependent oxidoreductase [Bacteroidota bacterium]
MKNIVIDEFGSSDKLRIIETSKPEPKINEVLVQIKAAAVNMVDIRYRTGFMQTIFPIQFPFTFGIEISGIIDAVGENVTIFKKGDEVFARIPNGGYSEFAVISADLVVQKPDNINFIEAASLPVALTTSLFLMETLSLTSGQRILIQGAAGSVGYIFSQIANNMGLDITATASGEGIEKLKMIGVTRIIDYAKEDFKNLVTKMDAVIDFVGGPTQIQLYGVLKKGGMLVSTAMPPDIEKANQIGVKAIFIATKPDTLKLKQGAEWVKEGLIKPFIAKTLPLTSAAEAQDLVEKGRPNGKVVLVINDKNEL